jgi:hypothetical protein
VKVRMGGSTHGRSVDRPTAHVVRLAAADRPRTRSRATPVPA